MTRFLSAQNKTMDKLIEFKDKTCNCWVLVFPKRLSCKSAKNIHLVEVEFNHHNNTIRRWSTHTYCDEELIQEKKYIEGCIFHNTLEGCHALRKKVAELQNSGYEVCGNCAGHLYADPVA